jgi:membrane fusion protein, multidrug efflux system
VNTPRIRNDLKVTPAEEQGIKYFDVSDPRSGQRMRMYDFEWLIAERMNGERQFDEVANWARDTLGLNPSTEDLTAYADKLKGLGFFEVGGGTSGVNNSSGALKPIIENDIVVEEDVTPLPDPHPAEVTGQDLPKMVPAKPDQPTMTMEAPTPRQEARKTDSGVHAVPALTPVAPRPSATPTGQRPMANTSEPSTHESASTGKVETPPPPAKKSSGGSIVALLVLILAIGGGILYLKFGPQAAHVSVTLAAPREVVRLFDGAATVKKAEPQVLAFGEAGKVTDVVAKGTEAKAGMPLATLEAYAKIEKDLADVRDRLGFYEKALQAAQAKGNADEIKKAEGKVAEKKALSVALEARAGKVRIVAPGSGTVTDVNVAAGEDARPGVPAIKMGDKRLSAEIKVPPAEAPKTGETVQLQAAAGGATFSGRVTRVGDGVVTIELPDDTTAKVGDSLRLVKKRETNVIPVPAAAVTKRDNVDVVFVLADGVVHLRKVTVVDRSPTEMLISSGLATGDSVITSGAADLQDGQKASTQ